VYVLERMFKRRRYSFNLGEDATQAIGALYSWNADSLAFIEAYEARQRKAMGFVAGAVYLKPEVLTDLDADMRGGACRRSTSAKRWPMLPTGRRTSDAATCGGLRRCSWHGRWPNGRRRVNRGSSPSRR
jgi:hypothetical protein